MKQRLRTFSAVLRVELRGLVPFTLGVALCAVLACAWARFEAGLHAPLGSSERGGLLAAVIVLMGVPVVAAAFESAGATSLRKGLRPLPVGGDFLARVAAALVAMACAAATVSGADATLAAAAPLGESSSASMLLGERAFRSITVGLGVFTWLVTLFLATFLQHALGATLLGLGAAALPIAALVQMDRGGLAAGTLHALFGELGWIGLTVMGLCALWSCATVTPLRGPRARSVWRRAPRAALAPLMLLAIPAAGFASRTLTSPEPTWDDPGARIARIVVGSDGRRVAVTLYHAEPRTRVQSFWLVDTETGTREEIPHPVDGAFALLRPALDLASWTHDGDGLGVILWRQDRDAGADFRTYSFEGGWGPWQTYDQWISRVGEGGWRGRLDRDGNGLHRRLESLVAPELPPIRLSERSLQYPRSLPTIAVGVSRDGTFVRCDARTGQVESLGIRAPEDIKSFRVSPALRWLLWTDTQQHRWLAEVATGQVVPVGKGSSWLTDRGLPLTTFPSGGQRHLTIAGPGGSEVILRFSEDIAQPRDLRSGRWLVQSRDQGLWVADDEGRRLRVLRKGGEVTP